MPDGTVLTNRRCTLVAQAREPCAELSPAASIQVRTGVVNPTLARLTNGSCNFTAHAAKSRFPGGDIEGNRGP